MRILNTCKAILREMSAAAGRATFASFIRYSLDLVAIRIHSSNRERRIRLRCGILITYRLNRGDMQSIREVWLDEAYRLPYRPQSDVLVDLGANIGLTSLWMAKHYNYSKIIAVEPSSDNARLAALNLRVNGVTAEIIEAAVTPEDGTAYFEDSEMSNMGHLGDKGKPVRAVSMETVLDGMASCDLKMDIEGGEEALLQGDTLWLNRVNSIIAEFHPDIIDYPRAIEAIKKRGFRYIPAGTAHKDSMDAFLRASL